MTDNPEALAAEAYEVVFCGGPRNGETAALPDLPWIYRFPVMPPVAWIYSANDPDVDTLPSRCLVYELEITYRDGDYRYRYEYKGTR